METLIKDQWSALGEFDRKHAIKLVIDEWGSWHPAGTEINPRHLFEQMGTLRDALVAALTLDTFNRHAGKIDMANIAQLVNNLHSLFLADGDKLVATPTYHVYTLYRPHQNAKAVRLAVEAPDVPFQAGGRGQQLFRLAGSASRTGEKQATLTLVHSHANQPAEVVIRIKGAAIGQVRWTVLTNERLNAFNSFEQPQTVIPKQQEIRLSGRGPHPELSFVVPPASVSRFDIDLA
ncbi:MAG: alpha-L-arabinofuranosidase C-terminal domain-containing protein [Isosphaeraceae bacterium]